MVTSRYPLARLAELRAQRATGAAIDLAAALAGLAEAEAQVEAATAAVAAATAAARAMPLVGGAETAAPEVLRRAAYGERLRRDLERARARLAIRQAERDEWQAAVVHAQGRMTEARAEHRVVERHRERWQDVAAKRRDRRED